MKEFGYSLIMTGMFAFALFLIVRDIVLEHLEPETNETVLVTENGDIPLALAVRKAGYFFEHSHRSDSVDCNPENFDFEAVIINLSLLTYYIVMTVLAYMDIQKHTVPDKTRQDIGRVELGVDEMMLKRHQKG